MSETPNLTLSERIQNARLTVERHRAITGPERWRLLDESLAHLDRLLAEQDRQQDADEEASSGERKRIVTGW